jgi:hypothetical protein
MLIGLMNYIWTKTLLSNYDNASFIEAVIESNALVLWIKKSQSASVTLHLGSWVLINPRLQYWSSTKTILDFRAGFISKLTSSNLSYWD